MGGVGDKLPPGALRLLEPVHQLVELPGDLGKLVVAGEDSPLVVGSLPDPPDGVLQAAQPSGQLPGEDHAQHHHQRGDADRDAQQGTAEIFQQRCLLGVVLIDVDAADDLVAVEHRLGGGGMEGPLLVHAVHVGVSLQGLHQVVVKYVAARGAAHLPGVVEHSAVEVRHDGPGHPRQVHSRQGLSHIFLRQLVQAGHGGVQRRRAAEQGAALGLEHQVLAHQQRIRIHQHHHRQQHCQVAGADFQL